MLQIMEHRDSFTTDVVNLGGSEEREARTKSNAQIDTRKTHHSLRYRDGLSLQRFLSYCREVPSRSSSQAMAPHTRIGHEFITPAPKLSVNSTMDCVTTNLDISATIRTTEGHASRSATVGLKMRCELYTK